MSPFEQAKCRWGRIRAMRALEKCRVAMAPHIAVLETDVGKRSLFLVSGFAALVYAGVETPAALADAVKLAQTISGIPADALDLYAQYAFAFLEGAAIEQQDPIPGQTADREGSKK